MGAQLENIVVGIQWGPVVDTAQSACQEFVSLGVCPRALSLIVARDPIPFVNGEKSKTNPDHVWVSARFGKASIAYVTNTAFLLT